MENKCTLDKGLGWFYGSVVGTRKVVGGGTRWLSILLDQMDKRTCALATSLKQSICKRDSDAIVGHPIVFAYISKWIWSNHMFFMQTRPHSIHFWHLSLNKSIGTLTYSAAPTFQVLVAFPRPISVMSGYRVHVRRSWDLRSEGAVAGKEE